MDTLRRLFLPGLWLLFFVICFDLGYPTLNRYAPASTLPDAAQYRTMLLPGARGFHPPFSYRVLTPWLARGVYGIAHGHIGTWDPAYFSLLVVNATFMAGTAVLVFLLGAESVGAEAGCIAAFLYIVNFAVSNLLLAGLVDAGQAFFLTAIMLALLKGRWGFLPVLLGVGALAKETVVPLGGCLILTWAVSTGTGLLRRKLGWTALSLMVGMGVVTGLATTEAGGFASASILALQQVHAVPGLPGTVVPLLMSRDLWRPFVYLLPLGLVQIKALPRAWRVSVAWTLILALLLVVFHSAPGDVGSTFGRIAFVISGPVLSVSAAVFLQRAARGTRTGVNSRPASA